MSLPLALILALGLIAAALLLMQTGAPLSPPKKQRIMAEVMADALQLRPRSNAREQFIAGYWLGLRSIPTDDERSSKIHAGKVYADAIERLEVGCLAGRPVCDFELLGIAFALRPTWLRLGGDRNDKARDPRTYADAYLKVKRLAPRG